MSTTARDWRSLHRGLRRFVLSRVGDQALADDLVQETLLRLHTRLERIEDERVLAYAYRVASNVVVDHFRLANKERALQRDLGDNSFDIQPSAADEARVILGQWITTQIAGLPLRYREVLQRVELDGQSQRDVADALGLSYSTVKSRVQRGRDLLHAELLACCSVEVDGQGRVTDFSRRDTDGCSSPCSEDCGEVC